MVSLLYRIARAAAWGSATGRALHGNIKPLYHRFRNKIFYKALGRALRAWKP
jgi:hypothetical protein